MGAMASQITSLAIVYSTSYANKIPLNFIIANDRYYTHGPFHKSSFVHNQNHSEIILFLSWF